MKIKKKGRDVPSLHHLLSYRRAHNSPGERQYVIDHIKPLNPELIATDKGEVMAFIVRVGTSPIMFTSHTDSVHMNVETVWQKVLFKNGLYCKNDNQPLGADDAAGNWLMFHMIAAKVPGIYAFFRGEERGGIGSSYCAKHRQDLFEGIKCAIALDRKGTSSVITHQAGSRGCSDEFGLSLAKILGMGHKLDPGGIYTDTAEFFGLVPNCTNLSVGYDREHSKHETLNKGYIEALCNALIKADWAQLDHTEPSAADRFDSLRGYSPWEMPDDDYQSPLFGDARDSGMRRLIAEATEVDDVTPLQIADFLFDYADRLPRDLRDKALSLSQTIYKRYE